MGVFAFVFLCLCVCVRERLREGESRGDDDWHSDSIMIPSITVLRHAPRTRGIE